MQTFNSKPESNYRVNEYRYDSASVIKSTYGTALQSVRPEIVFVKGKAKFKPEESKNGYLEDICKVEQWFKAKVKEFIHGSQDFNDRYLLTYSFSETAIRYGKPSLLRYELMLKPKQKEVISKVSPLLTDIIDKINAMLIDVMDKYNFKVYS